MKEHPQDETGVLDPTHLTFLLTPLNPSIFATRPDTLDLL